MKKPVGYCLGFVVILAILILAYLGYSRWQQGQREADLARVALALGNSAANQIDQNTRCWDIFSHCGMFVYFQTLLSQKQAEAALQGLQFTVDRSNTIDGYSAYTYINLGTSHRLTAGGEDGTVRQNLALRPSGYEWRLIDTHGRSWVARFFDVGNPAVPYLLDNQPLDQNLIVLMLQTR